MITEITIETALPTAGPSTGSSRWAIVGSPIAPIPIEVIVIPTWQAEM